MEQEEDITMKRTPLKCNSDCIAICDFCLFFDFNGGEYGIYTGHGACWNPYKPGRVSPTYSCEHFICFSIIED